MIDYYFRLILLVNTLFLKIIQIILYNSTFSIWSVLYLELVIFVQVYCGSIILIFWIGGTHYNSWSYLWFVRIKISSKHSGHLIRWLSVNIITKRCLCLTPCNNHGTLKQFIIESPWSFISKVLWIDLINIESVRRAWWYLLKYISLRKLIL